MSVVIFLAVLMVTGAILLLVGVRGRRIDDHPLCRACGFDLVGSVSAISSVCTECGTSIASQQNIRIGNRRRHRRVIAVGASMLVVSLLTAGPFVLVPFLGMNSAKPDWLLLAEVEYGSGRWQSSAMDELLDRWVTAKLGEGSSRQLALLAAAVHRDPNARWTRQWSECLNDDALFALLPQNVQDTAALQGIEPALKVRPRVRGGKGAAVPIGIALPGHDRILRAQSRRFLMDEAHWRVLDSAGKVVGEGTRTNMGYNVGLSDFPGSSSWSTIVLACDLEPGKHTIHVDVEGVVTASATFWRGHGAPLPAGPKIVRELKGEFEVAPPGVQVVEVVDNAAILEQLRGAVVMPSPGIVRQPDRSEGIASLNLDVVWAKGIPANIPKGLETQWKATLWLADGSAPVPGAVQEYAPQLPIQGGVAGGMVRFRLSKPVEPGKYLQRFTPDIEEAERSTYIEKILGGTLEFEIELRPWPAPTR